MSSDRWTIHQIDEGDSFRDLREEWNSLLADSASDNFFLTWEWLYSWWQHLGGDRRLEILTVRDGDTLVGAAPLARRRGAIPALEFLGTGSVGSDYLDIIVRREYEDSVVALIADEIRAGGLPLFLGGVRAEGSLSSRLAASLDGMGWAHGSTVTNTCAFIDLDGEDWDGYLAGLSSSHRYNFRRRLRNMERDYAVSFQQPTTPTECAGALDILVDLHRRRWEDRGGSDALHRRELVAFHHEVARRIFANGWLRLFVLRLDGRPAAAFYGFHYRGRFLFYQSGFDPDFAKLSPSLVTLGLTIREAIDEGAHEYDLLHGAESYKSRWASQERSLEKIECYPPGVATALIRGAREVSAGARSMARQILPQPVAAALAGLRERVS